MSQTIYKYELRPGTTGIDMPKNAQVLSAQAQGDGVFIWARLRTENDMEFRTFEVYGTGHKIPDVDGEMIFIGTAMMHGGALVWHVFERKL